MPRIELTATTLHYLDRGHGQPLLLLHGFPFDHSVWRHQLDELSQHYRVIVPDLRGFGQSTVEPIGGKTGVRMAAYADDMAALLDQLGVSEPVVLGGLSMGGYIAFQFFVRHRARLRGLMLCSTKAAADTPQVRETRYQMATRVEEWGTPRVAQLMVPKLFATATLAERPEVVADLLQVMERTNPHAIAAAQRGMAHREDSTSLLPQIDLPTLVLAGSDDTISTPAEMKRMSEAMPQSTYVEIPAAGHMTLLEQPAAVNAAINQWLSQLA